VEAEARALAAETRVRELEAAAASHEAAKDAKTEPVT